MPEEEFERDGFQRYIVFKLCKQSNDLRMLAENQIEGVLVHQLKNINGAERLYYHIEGCQPISVVYGHRLWDYTALKSLFQAICECIYTLREYLLPLDALLLDTEHIYWSWQEERAKFLVVPDCEEPISRQLTRLTEYLMQHVDYQDKKAADWLYRFYDALRKQGGSYELLCEYCREGSNEEMLTAFAEKAEPKAYDPETERALQEMYYMGESKWRQRVTKCVNWIKGIWENKNIKETENARVYEENKMESKKTGEGKRIGSEKADEGKRRGSEKADEGKRRGSEKDDEGKRRGGEKDNEGKRMRSERVGEEERIGSERVSEEERIGIKKACDVEESKRKIVVDLEAEQDYDSATTLLSESANVLRLKPVDTGYPYIVPQKQSMLIGRQEASCNYVLSCRDISRVHASIVLSDEAMLITDLNSSNGTYVNQKRLGIQESVIVKQGDEVCFGSVKYVAV